MQSIILSILNGKHQNKLSGHNLCDATRPDGVCAVKPDTTSATLPCSILLRTPSAPPPMHSRLGPASLQHPEPGEHQTHAHTHAPTLEMVIGGPNTPKWPFKPPPQTKRHHECQFQPHKARPTEASSDIAQTKLKRPSSMIHGLLVPPLPPRQQPYAWWRSNTKKERQSPWSPPV